MIANFPSYAVKDATDHRSKNWKPGQYEIVVSSLPQGDRKPFWSTGIQQMNKEPDSNQWTQESVDKKSRFRSEAKRIADRLNQISFGLFIKGKRFDRFKTKWYIALSKDQALRLSAIDNTPISDFGITEDVEILHSANNFILWSDGKITKSVLLIPRGGKLTKDAVRMITACRESDTGHVSDPDGLLLLAEIDKILKEETISSGDARGHYAPETVKELTIQWLDGSTGSLFVHTAGYFEGYQYDVYTSLDDLKLQASPATSPTGISCFPADDFEYDEVLGYVKSED